MLDLSTLRTRTDDVRRSLLNRGAAFDINDLLARDERRRSLMHRVHGLKASRKESGTQIAQLKREDKDAVPIIEQMQSLAGQIQELEAQLVVIDASVTRDLLTLPNIPHESVPVGPDEQSNSIERTWGDPPEMDFKPLDHVALGEALGIIDMRRASKLSGARFPAQFGTGAQLERALAALMIDLHRERGYLEVLPPFLVSPQTMQGTGQLPKFAEDSFYIERDNLYLIPTSEVPLVNLHAGEVLPEAELPVRYCSYTPCFRREAGSYGRDTRGLIRVHQFNKVELVWITRPEGSYEDLAVLTAAAEAVLQTLELPYRVVNLASGDLGFAAAKTYDLEVWLPSQSRYREISSCSNCEAFQARRADIRFRPAPGDKPRLAHTLNGSGVAVGRALVALLEVHQQADGTVRLPDALRPYMSGLEVIEPIDRPGC